MKRVSMILAALLLAAPAFGQNGPCVVPGRGFFRIHVGAGGLFGAFAHNHSIEAQKTEGCAAIDAKDLTHSSIKLIFQAASVRVMDPDASVNDRAAVQQTMETEVLHVKEFPQIVFQSTSIERGSGANELKIHGNLTIRDKTLPVIIPLTFQMLADGTYQATGKYNFKQTSFGIKPIQLAEGTIKVKDELETEFELYLK
jgi:polyisoprenoid-binding protein YceI